MEDPVPLEICPWWSGIYALHDVYRAGGEGNTSDNKVPAILSAYITEFGDCCLLMHVLDDTHIEGGSIAWCNWTGVGYRGGNRVSQQEARPVGSRRRRLLRFRQTGRRRP